ncbi:hypothetical protein BpHYR1_014221 [Brachionus plicatilis]|uniref:Uncharacterized protein n=1 Tax=Brachionus plicatilis TaxID=10195 RepID=A0A3M7SBX1_BRAPC|nr:hypothetical protein BpHYR1_014221 [Brachionus plicatilis]
MGSFTVHVFLTQKDILYTMKILDKNRFKRGTDIYMDSLLRSKVIANKVKSPLFSPLEIKARGHFEDLRKLVPIFKILWRSVNPLRFFEHPLIEPFNDPKSDSTSASEFPSDSSSL